MEKKSAREPEKELLMTEEEVGMRRRQTTLKKKIMVDIHRSCFEGMAQAKAQLDKVKKWRRGGEGEVGTLGV